ncbi:hypothetical protein L1987_56423 [Smallanthus sonchifolius]|uniref:Uncharacterized protein n=1 Tax=Smallanthus sonchifolius TaxID=185202 RepID=A0ACB9ECU0_9ASTR|nr:hypothetical protein L1987_56423 [Smallanthus sonchifolius]
MAMKSIFLITVLVLVLVATQAQAQITIPPIRIPPLGIPPLPIPPVLPPLGIPPLGVPPVGVGALLNISGVLFCSVNGSVVNGTTPTPPFPNATVQLSCDGTVLASTTTNQSGAFTISVNPAQVLTIVSSSSCMLVVPTPLSTCNATLPSTGSLQSLLQIVRDVITGIVTSIVPLGFELMARVGR